MAFDWNEYLIFAETLNTKQSKSEAEERTIVSRAYYSAFKLFSRYFELINQPLPTTGAAHSEAIKKIKKNGWLLQATKMESLRDLRNDADYESTLSNLNTNVFIALQEANKLKDFINPKIQNKLSTVKSTP